MGEYLISVYDKSADGTIQFVEFVQLVRGLWKNHAAERQKGCVARIEKNIDIFNNVFKSYLTAGLT